MEARMGINVGAISTQRIDNRRARIAPPRRFSVLTADRLGSPHSGQLSAVQARLSPCWCWKGTNGVTSVV